MKSFLYDWVPDLTGRPFFISSFNGQHDKMPRAFSIKKKIYIYIYIYSSYLRGNNSGCFLCYLLGMVEERVT